MYSKDSNNLDHAIARWMNNYVVHYVSAIDFDLYNTIILDYMNSLEQEGEVKYEDADEPLF